MERLFSMKQWKRNLPHRPTLHEFNHIWITNIYDHVIYVDCSPYSLISLLHTCAFLWGSSKLSKCALSVFSNLMVVLWLTAQRENLGSQITLKSHSFTCKYPSMNPSLPVRPAMNWIAGYTWSYNLGWQPVYNRMVAYCGNYSSKTIMIQKETWLVKHASHIAFFTF